MRFLLLSVGSRGDTEPYLALTQDLLNRHHTVDLFVATNHRHLAEPYVNHPGFRLHSFPFATADFALVQQQSREDAYVHPDPRMKHVGTVANIISELVLPCLDQVYQLVTSQQDEGNAIHGLVTSAYTRYLAILVGRKLNLPTFLVHLQPLLPNRFFPSYRTSRTRFIEECIAGNIDKHDDAEISKCNNETIAADFEETYWRIEHALTMCFLREPLKTGAGTLSLTPLSWSRWKLILTGHDAGVWIVNAYSNHLVPRLVGRSGVGEQVAEVGPLADTYIPPNFIVPTTLGDFLAGEDGESPLPLCVGFGSMLVTRDTVRTVFNAIHMLDPNLRVVLVGRSFVAAWEDYKQESTTFAKKLAHRVIVIPSVPYAYLLSKCSMMLCHGGVGVVQACLRAGIPCLASPVMGDQFALSELVAARGLGVQCGTQLSELSSKDIVNAVSLARRNCTVRCRTLGRSIHNTAALGDPTAGAFANYGTGRLVELLESVS